MKLIGTNKYVKDSKIAQRRGKDLEKLRHILNLLVQRKPLPFSCHVHKLTGNWAGTWECHIEPDWLLIYECREDAIILHRTGSHADLFV